MKSLRGFALLSAIFILVVLAALGAFILSVSTNQQIGSALDVQGVRAYQAARAGLEWGIYKVQSSYNFGRSATDGSETDPNSRICPAGPIPSFQFSGVETLAGFTVTVSCQASTPAHSEPKVFIVSATACTVPNPTEPMCPNTSNPGNLYIERRLTVTF